MSWGPVVDWLHWSIGSNLYWKCACNEWGCCNQPACQPWIRITHYHWVEKVTFYSKYLGSVSSNRGLTLTLFPNLLLLPEQGIKHRWYCRLSTLPKQWKKADSLNCPARLTLHTLATRLGEIEARQGISQAYAPHISHMDWGRQKPRQRMLTLHTSTEVGGDRSQGTYLLTGIDTVD